MSTPSQTNVKDWKQKQNAAVRENKQSLSTVDRQHPSHNEKGWVGNRFSQPHLFPRFNAVDGRNHNVVSLHLSPAQTDDCVHRLQSTTRSQANYRQYLHSDLASTLAKAIYIQVPSNIRYGVSQHQRGRLHAFRHDSRAFWCSGVLGVFIPCYRLW
jgi:hypothetical protein